MPRFPTVLFVLRWMVAVGAGAVVTWGGPDSGAAPAAAQETGSRLFAAHVLALRAAGVAGDPEAAEFLATLPGSRMVPREALSVLWGPTFANSMVILGRLESPGPVALFYDPLLDVAVVTHWAAQGAGYRVVRARALPGARLDDPRATTGLAPPWMTSAGDPVGALTALAAARVDAFHRMHPAASSEPGGPASTFAADAADFRNVLPRLTWHAHRRAQWSDGTQPWLEPTVVDIEAALGAGNAAVLRAAAPDTDAETASVLAGLPPAFAGALALDMWLAAGATSRLVIGSLPEDGDVYVLTFCRLEGTACRLRQFVLLSLSG